MAHAPSITDVQTDALPVTAIMLLKVSRNTSDKMIDATANTDMGGLSVRHPVRHLTSWHIKCLHISDIHGLMMPAEWV